MDAGSASILLGLIGGGVLVVVGVCIYDEITKKKRSLEAYGLVNAVMTCPHCQTKGKVRTKQLMKKGGISGTKVMAALCTIGVSLLFTGLAKKDQITQAHCGECGNIWFF